MVSLTIRMTHEEKQRLACKAASKGLTVTQYIMELVASDMQTGTPDNRAAAWLREHREALCIEAEHIAHCGIPGAGIALHHPTTVEEARGQALKTLD